VAEDEERLRGLLTDMAPDFDALHGGAIRAGANAMRGSAVSRTRRVLLPSVSAAVILAVTLAVTLFVRGHAPSRGPASTSLPTAPTPTAVTSHSATNSPFRIELVLPATTFPANGHPIDASVLIINDTGAPIEVRDGCNVLAAAGLTNSRVSLHIAFAGVGCASKNLPTGITRIPMQIPTTFTACQQGKRPGTADVPHCIGPNDSRAPNLPAGTYLAEVQTNMATTGRRPALPRPQAITLTP
jgi:hypothetical protein